MGLAREFREFAMKGNVIDMAVGVIIGTAFGKIVASLVEDVFMPPLGKVIGDVNFSDLAVNLGVGADGKTEVLWKYGNFLQITFQFLEPVAPPAPIAPPRQEILLQEIRDLLAKK